MAFTVSSSKSDTNSSPSRAPLLPRSFSTNVTSQKHTLRHKASFILRTDSTDDPLSPHGSIYDAQLYDASYLSASEGGNDTFETVPLSDPEPSSPPPRVVDENVRGGETRIPSLTIPDMLLSEMVLPESEISDLVSPDIVIPDVEFRYGNGTALDTITEQKSSTTMRSLARAKSVDNLPKVIRLTHVDSFELSNVPRRMQSLSLDELTLIKRSYHDAVNKIESKKGSPAVSVHEIYARPMSPIHAPVVRPSTPPGMPSWTAGQNVAQPQRTSSRHRSVLDRFFGLSCSYSSRVQPPSPVSPSLYGLTRLPPRFRPPRSSYAAIDQHPFTRAPVALIPIQPGSRPIGKRKPFRQVRFTPSATARDSEMNVLRGAIESTSAVAINPVAPIVTTATSLPGTTCSHRSGCRSLLRALGSSLNFRGPRPANTNCGAMELPQAVDWQRPVSPSMINQAGSPSRTDSIPSGRPSMERPVIAQGTAGSGLSNTSTDCLMSGGIPDGHPPSRPKWCWKCKVDKVVVKMDKWWYNCTACMCFVCCGFDIDEDRHDLSRRAGTGFTIPNAGFRYLDGAVDCSSLPPRRVILDQTPAVTF